MFLIDEKITVRRLEVLLAFLEAGTIARAAEQLGTSAVSVHRALKSLEEGLRCPLFLQEGRNLVPQESARELAEAAKETIRTLQHGIDNARAAGGYSSDQLRIGSMYSLTIRLVPRLLVELKVHKPLMQIDLVLDSNEKLLQKLRSGHIDAALIELPQEQPDDLEMLPIFDDELMFAAPMDWQGSDSSVVDLERCSKERFVSLTDDFATGRDMQRMLAKAGFNADIVMRTGDIFSLMSLVSGGVGCSLLPARAKEVFSDKIQWLGLEHKYRHSQRIGLVCMKSRERSPNVLSLLRACRIVRTQLEKEGLKSA